MSLILPPWGFANSVTNLTGTPPASAVGTTFTAAANNADGTAVEVLADLTFDAHYLVVGISNTNASAGNGQTLLDILTDPAGGTSYGAFIDDLVCGMTPNQTVLQGIGCWYHFPIYIPAGSAVAVRARQRHTVDISGRVVVYAHGNPSRPEMWWCGQKVESLGINAATSQGTDVTPGASGADGAWTTIGTSGHRYGAVQYGVNGSDATAAARGYFWDIGYGSAALGGAPRGYRTMDTAESGVAIGNNQVINCDVAAGTTWQLRATSSGTAEVWNAGIYGVY
jgi:hypothetical protein